MKELTNTALGWGIIGGVAYVGYKLGKRQGRVEGALAITRGVCDIIDKRNTDKKEEEA